MPVLNLTQLITYPDSLGGDLKALDSLLEKQLEEFFPGGVHILPPYPSSGDRGFAPLTYKEIDPHFGTWANIRSIGARIPVMLDLMVNHVSRQSPYFQDFARRGRNSEYADLFITLDKVWPGGGPRREEVARIFLRRPEHPFTDVIIAETGATERIWATFGAKDAPQQIDIDVNSSTARRLLKDILAHFSRQNLRILRLDAIAYVTKKAGTSCFFVEPDIWEFLDWMRSEARAVGIDLLPEVHAHYTIQEKLAEHGYWVYNFVLPLLILHALETGSAVKLGEHLRTCPRKQFTMLDCHDGIPVQPDLDDVLTVDEAQRIVRTCLQRGANLNRVLASEHQRRPDFDAHQINITYYSALDANDDAYLAARAIQLFAPGVPQIYYVGLLAGKNDLASVAQTGEGRAINRHNYTHAEIEAGLEKPVVRRLLNLIRFRNWFPAFQGRFEVVESDRSHLSLAWRSESAWCRLDLDVESHAARIEYQEGGSAVQVFTP